ncbi:unnamed protein product [Alopecurus aequalis]
MAAAVCKRSAAIFDAGHASSTEHGSDTGCSKRRRIGSTEAYETTGILGAGSFGIVKKARHCATGKTVAIKFLRPTTDASELPEEARFLEACEGNPHVVRSHCFVRDPDTTKLCLSMEYVGPNLEAFLSERPPLPEAVVCAFMWQLLNGAKDMHERGIVHRDIKPPNILVGEGGKILKFCDLGLAMSLATEKTPYGDAGTVPYMAPEMLLGKTDYDAKVDAWSLGCVMAEMLTGGKRLFNSKGARRGDKIDQLRTIFGVLGLPDDRTWPEFASLPLAHTVRRSFQARENDTLGELFHPDMLSEDGFTVLKGLLECNPDKRLTAAAALQLPWLLPEIDRFATPEKKDVMWIKNTPPVALEKINFIIPRPTLKKKKKNVRQINFIPPEPPKHKNVLRVPLAMWKSAQLMDPCKC